MRVLSLSIAYFLRAPLILHCDMHTTERCAQSASSSELVLYNIDLGPSQHQATETIYVVMALSGCHVFLIIAPSTLHVLQIAVKWQSQQLQLKLALNRASLKSLSAAQHTNFIFCPPSPLQANAGKLWGNSGISYEIEEIKG